MGRCAAKRTRAARGGRLVRLKGQIVSVAPSSAFAFAAGVALSVSPLTAEEVSTAVDFPVVFNLDEDNTITETGSVDLSIGGTAVGLVPDYSSVFTNNGLVRGPAPLVSIGNGVQVLGQLLPTGQVINNGEIDVAVDTPDNAFAQGILFSQDVGGRVLNTGRIAASSTVATGTGTASVSGIQFDGMVLSGAAIENSGEVISIANGSSTVELNVLGLAFNNEVATNLTNSGTIRAEGTNAGIGNARGIQIFLDRPLTGDINNSGFIQATIENAESASAIGTIVQGLMTGDFNNSGQTIAEAQGAASATAIGYNLTADLDGNFINSGEIDARAESATSVIASGVDITGRVDGEIRNSGSVVAIAEAGSAAGTGEASGIRVGDMQGRFSNTGVISATASGAGSADAFGLHFGNFDGVIADVGRISATSENGQAYAIYLGTGTGTLNVDSRDDVTGLIRVQDHNVNLDAQGGSTVFFFEDAAPGSGAFVTTVSDGRSAWFVEDEGGSAPVYAVVDGADIVTSGDIIAYYGSVVGRTAEALRYDLPEQPARGLAFASSASGFRPFAMIDAELRRFESTPGINTDLEVFNGVAGYSGQAENGLSMAFGLGVFRSDGDTDTTDFDTTGIYLDAAFGRQFGAFTVEGGLGFGWLSTDRSRQVSGSSDAEADFDSTLFTAHIGAKRSFDVSDTFGLFGFGDVRYTRQKDDSYSETGSIANASVGETTTEVIEARLGVEVEKTLADGGLLIGKLSGVVRRDLGDTDADVTVFSDTQTLSFAATDFTGASVLVGYEHDLQENMRLEVTAEHEIGNEAQGPNFLAGIRWNF